MSTDQSTDQALDLGLQILFLLCFAILAFIIFDLLFQLAARLFRPGAGAPARLNLSILTAISVSVQGGRTQVAVATVQTAGPKRAEFNVTVCSASSSSPPATLLPVQCEKIKPDLVGIIVEGPTSKGVSGLAH